MQVFDYSRPALTIAHPECPECGGEMWLARIEPDRPDHDRRTFECQTCLKVVIKIVKYQ
jgi:hypothetical protein